MLTPGWQLNFTPTLHKEGAFLLVLLKADDKAVDTVVWPLLFFLCKIEPSCSCCQNYFTIRNIYSIQSIMKRKAEELEEEEEATLLSVLEVVLSRDFLRWYDAKKLQSTSKTCKTICDTSPVPDWDRLYEFLFASVSSIHTCRCDIEEEDDHYHYFEDEESECFCTELKQRLDPKGTAFLSISIQKKCELLSIHKARLVRAFRTHFDYQRLNQVTPLDHWNHGAGQEAFRITYPQRHAFTRNVALHLMAAEEFKVGLRSFADIFLGHDGFNLNRLGEFHIRWDGYLSAIYPGHDAKIKQQLLSEQCPHRNLLGPLYEKTEIVSVFFTGDEIVLPTDLEDDSDLVIQHRRSEVAIQGALESFPQFGAGNTS